MSGGGGSGDAWRPEPKPVTRKSDGVQQGGGGASAFGACDVVENTTLNSPNRTVIATLRQGDVLDVDLDSGPPQRLLAATRAGATAGSITSPSMLQIITCIKAGHAYIAEVLTIRGAVCQIQIRPK